MLASDRRGFTLIELIAAISVMGFVMIGGLMLLDQLGDSARRISQERNRAARDGNGQRLLRQLLLDAASSVDSTKRLRGDEHGIELSTLCSVPAGWSEPCHATLAIDARADSSVLWAELSTGEAYSLRRQAGRAEFRYFNPAQTDTLWVRQWSSNVALPTAIGLLVGRDTVVFPVSAGRD